MRTFIENAQRQARIQEIKRVLDLCLLHGNEESDLCDLFEGWLDECLKPTYIGTLKDRISALESELYMKKPSKWEDLKQRGSDHYKGQGEVEPIDLMKAGGILHDKAIGDIIKYAYRNRREVEGNVSVSDLRKIIHYAEILIALAEEGK
jgi:hypothetical protein